MHWDGIDVLVNVRPQNGVSLQGGLSSGRTTMDNCEMAARLRHSDGHSQAARRT